MGKPVCESPNLIAQAIQAHKSEIINAETYLAVETFAQKANLNASDGDIYITDAEKAIYFDNVTMSGAAKGFINRVFEESTCTPQKVLAATN
ncbi:MAG: hypothetical protein ABII18_02805 [bacterium]|nr:hypothetical protein [bacterium]MBU1916673.1 hypothetical protein [bacterium]